MAKFLPGQSGNPAGRKKGVVSTRTKIVQSFADAIVAGGTARFKKELNKLEGKQYVDAYLTLLEYTLPKKARIEHTHEGDMVRIAQVFKIGDKEITL
jgi:hypothetical protein